jgi:hypothetical protein
VISSLCGFVFLSIAIKQAGPRRKSLGIENKPRKGQNPMIARASNLAGLQLSN